jgi:hypothetical protein
MASTMHCSNYYYFLERLNVVNWITSRTPSEKIRLQVSRSAKLRSQQILFVITTTTIPAVAFTEF